MMEVRNTVEGKRDDVDCREIQRLERILTKVDRSNEIGWGLLVKW